MNCELTIVNQPLPIPQPPSYPFVGNLPYLLGGQPLNQVLKLHQRYGPIFQVEVPNHRSVFVAGHELVDELCDETLFDKHISPPIQAIRDLVGSGLFTAETDDPAWQRVSRILSPEFRARAVQSYFPTMVEACEKLVRHWSQANGEVDVCHDMTRLTFDAIGACCFDYDFNSFARDTPHPFVLALARSFHETIRGLHRPRWISAILLQQRRQLQADREIMFDTVKQMVKDRLAKKHDDPPNLLDILLTDVDPETGLGLHYDEIRNQILTFLIAGHETTSGMLSFALYYLARDPALEQQARTEVDDVIGTRVPQFEDIQKLELLRRVLEESLRLWPTAPAFARVSKQDTLLAGKYEIPAGQGVDIILPALHRDPKVWDDPERFDADRFLPAQVRQRPPNAYKPFGHGRRTCIGKQFALTEGKLALAMILQNFELGLPRGPLKVHHTLTMKPSRFQLHPRKRRRSRLTLASEVDAGGWQP